MPLAHPTGTFLLGRVRPRTYFRQPVSIHYRRLYRPGLKNSRGISTGEALLDGARLSCHDPLLTLILPIEVARAPNGDTANIGSDNTSDFIEGQGCYHFSQ